MTRVYACFQNQHIWVCICYCMIIQKPHLMIVCLLTIVRPSEEDHACSKDLHKALLQAESGQGTLRSEHLTALDLLPIDGGEPGQSAQP